MFDVILKFFGIPFISPLTFWFLLGLAFSVAVAAGWIADAIMENLSFGIPLNSILLCVGAVLTFSVWRYLNLPMQREFMFLFIAGLGFFSASFLLACVFLKRFF